MCREAFILTPGEEVAPQGWQRCRVRPVVPHRGKWPRAQGDSAQGPFQLCRAAERCKHHPLCLKRGEEEEGRTTPGLLFFWLNSFLNQKLGKAVEDWNVPFAVKWGKFCHVEGSAQNHSAH